MKIWCWILDCVVANTGSEHEEEEEEEFDVPPTGRGEQKELTPEEKEKKDKKKKKKKQVECGDRLVDWVEYWLGIDWHAPYNNNNPLQKWKKTVKNSSVYVTGLPADTTEQELEALFSKIGVIKEDDQGGSDLLSPTLPPHTHAIPIDHSYSLELIENNYHQQLFVHLFFSSGKPRIKVYREAEGSKICKGDAAVTFLKEEAVSLAVQVIDGTDFRYQCPIHVEPAHFEPKGEFKPELAAAHKKTKLDMISEQKRMSQLE